MNSSIHCGIELAIGKCTACDLARVMGGWKYHAAGKSALGFDPDFMSDETKMLKDRMQTASDDPKSKADMVAAQMLAPGLDLLGHVVNDCMTGTAEEGDIALSDGSPITPGCIVTFKVAGDPLRKGKVYLGTSFRNAVTRQLFGAHRGPFFMSFCWKPFGVMLCPVDDLVELRKTSHVVRDGTLLPIDADDIVRGHINRGPQAFKFLKPTKLAEIKGDPIEVAA